ncbi:hypothetical protein [Nostoc sp. UHCC 0926]|uniref:hypothetical protein n=1 Tax=Nostoc sp. UHCC 0926 TaxID=3025190 RepID=UPI002362688C|nr:hypothetical protein [Nostoc sp. UHCC 0926]
MIGIIPGENPQPDRFTRFYGFGIPSFLKVIPIINSSDMGAIALIICCISRDIFWRLGIPIINRDGFAIVTSRSCGTKLLCRITE